MKDDTPFILECPSCRTRYEIPVAIPEGGRKVRCASCSHIWVAQPEDVFRMGEELPPLEGAEEVVFREGEDEAPEPESEAYVPGSPGDEASGEETASAEVPAPEAVPEEEETDRGSPKAFAAAVAEAEAKAEADDGSFRPAEDAVGSGSGDDLADSPAGDVADAEFTDTADGAGAASQADAPPQEGAGGSGSGGSQADEVTAFYGDPVQDAEDAGGQERSRSGRIAAKRPKRSAAARPGRGKKGFRAGLAAGWAVLLLAVGGIGYLAVTQRVEIVRLMPGSARLFEAVGLPVNIRGLDFHDVAYSWETDAGQVVLEVHGDIVNLTSRPLDVPSLILGLRDDTGTEVYQWEEAVMNTPLGAGDSATFAVRIPTPPRSIKSVQVRFARAR